MEEDTPDMVGGMKDMISDTAMVMEVMVVTMVDTVAMETEAMVDTEAMVEVMEAMAAMEEAMEDMAVVVAMDLVDLDITSVASVIMDSVDIMVVDTEEAMAVDTEEAMAVMVVATVVVMVTAQRFHKQLNHKNQLTRKTELLLVDLTSSTISHQRSSIALILLYIVQM